MSGVRRLLCLSALAMVLVSACGIATRPPESPLTPPFAALDTWKDFPADRQPRPIVLLGIDPPGQAYTNTSKIAALCRHFTLTISLPSEVPMRSTVNWSDGTTVSYPAISAAAAFAAMKQAPGSSEAMCSSRTPLSVTAAQFGSAGFPTDRGTATMSAWLFTATGAAADFIYPAIPPSALWSGGVTDKWVGGSATVSSDGLAVNFGFVGGECDAGYRTAVADSQSAVAVAVQAIPKDGVGACSAVGIARTAKVSLAGPLDGRVLVDASGNVVAVCPEATPRC
jgi:hypothetical protein